VEKEELWQDPWSSLLKACSKPLQGRVLALGKCGGADVEGGTMAGSPGPHYSRPAPNRCKVGSLPWESRILLQSRLLALGT
jgi:hypothetical protein